MAAASTSIFPKVYGVPLSQPFRSVVWLLLQKQVPFSIQLTVPGATSKFGSRHESYQAKTGVTTVPVLQTNETTYIPESAAILKYLCETNGWTDFYPSSHSPRRTPMVDAYLHWHHGHTRRCLSKLIAPHLRPGTGPLVPTDKDMTHCHETLRSLNDFWLSSSSSSSSNSSSSDNDDTTWIASKLHRDPTLIPSSCSIADLLAYEEVIQLPMTGLLDDSVFVDQYPAVKAWMGRMQTLPYHDAVHAALTALGLLVPTTTNDDDKNVKEEAADMTKRMGNATKTGLKAIQAAQDSYLKK